MSAELQALDDRMLKDIGLQRCRIAGPMLNGRRAEWYVPLADMDWTAAPTPQAHRTMSESARVLRGNQAYSASAAERHIEIADTLQQGVNASSVGRKIVGSGLVRRLVMAKGDPAKRRIRAWLSNIDDERLSRLGLTSADIAALRGTASHEVSKE